MKKALISMFVYCCFAGALFAVAQENALKLLENQTKRKLEIISYTQLSSSKMSIMVVADKINGYRNVLIVDDKQQNIIVAGAFFSANNKDMNDVEQTIHQTDLYNFKLKNSAALNNLFKNIPEDYQIKLQGKGNKITYIVSDPMCPHCREELENLESRLKNGSVVMILAGFMGDISVNKAANIIEKIKSAKTPQEQISIFKQVYAQTYAPNPSAQSTTNKVREITTMIDKTGLVPSVPFIYEAI